MNLQKFKNCLNEIDQISLDKLNDIIKNSRNIIILGNGGSNAISCHIAQDYTKMLGKRAMCFGDSSRLTCYANDYGWENAYTKFIEHFAEEDTLVILISSSGNSENILKAAEYCVGKYRLVTLSGFSPNNKLKENYSDKSLIHFYVGSTDYGIVECLHEVILHSVI
jgi:D-sedoheptulose 7-phosphate isomerase